MPRRPNGIGYTANQEMTILEKAMSGDMVLSVTPATATPAPTAAAWDSNIVIQLKTAAGELHTWANLSEATILSVATTSSAGTATIVPATTITLVNGQCTVVVSGDAAAWLNAETVTLTVADMTIMGYTISGGTYVATFTTA